MNERNTRVLIVDDQHEIYTDFQEMLKAKKNKVLSDDFADAFFAEEAKEEASHLPTFELAYAPSGDEAYEMVKTAKETGAPFAVAYIDIRMPPGMDGIETIRRIREFERDLEIIIMTAYTDKPLPEIVTNMELLHKLLYIRKPFTREEIQQITHSLVEKWNIEQESLKQQQQLALSNQRLETVLDATEDAIGLFDGAEKLLFANQQYCHLFDISKDQIQQISPEDINARIDARFRKLDDPEAVQANSFESGENILEAIGNTTTNNPVPGTFYCSTRPVSGSEPGAAGKVVSYRDMSKDAEIQRMKNEIITLRAELKTTYSFSGIIGKSPQMQRLFARIQRATEGNITVLIQGESGTGKELVAKSIHYNSARKAGPFHRNQLCCYTGITD